MSAIGYVLGFLQRKHEVSRIESLYSKNYLSANGEKLLRHELSSCTEELCEGAPLDLNSKTELKAEFVTEIGIENHIAKYAISVKQCGRRDFILVHRGSYGEQLIDSMIKVINPECKLIH